MFPHTIGAITNAIDTKRVQLYYAYDSFTEMNLLVQKYATAITYKLYGSGLVVNREYFIRIEETFLLSDSLAQ